MQTGFFVCVFFFFNFAVFLPDLEIERKREEEGKKEKVAISI